MVRTYLPQFVQIILRQTHKGLCTYRKIIFGQKIIFSSSCKTILSFIGGSALASQRNTAIYRFFTEPISRQSVFSSFAYFVDKYLNRNGVLTTFDIYTRLIRLVRRLPKGISAREVLMRNCYAVTLRIFVLCLYSFVLQEQKSFGISFALVSARRSTLCTDTKAKKSSPNTLISFDTRKGILT